MNSQVQESLVPEVVRADSPPRRRTWLGLALRISLPLIVIAVGVLGAARLIASAPHAVQRPPVHHASLVTVRPVERGAAPVRIEAMGRVVAAQQVELSPQVSGEVVEVHPAFQLGGRIPAGEILVRIESANYAAALNYAEAALQRRQAELESAQREIQRLTGLKERDAANRKELDDAQTAVAVAQADVAAARATRTQAALDLEHTVIRAPYTGIVTSEAVTAGAHVTPTTRLASFVGTDAYWVQISVPVDRLAWIDFPNLDPEGSAVRIVQQVGAGGPTAWHGRVLRLLGNLEPQGRMARVLVEVQHPLDAPESASQPLLIDAYVQVEIAGRRLPDVVALARSELRAGNSVWLMTAAGALEIRPVDVVFRGRQQVLVRSGLASGERVVVSDLPTPVAGMPLRVEGDPAPAVAATGAEKHP